MNGSPPPARVAYGPPKLRDIIKHALVRWKSLLGDVGYAPYELISEALAACTPSELAEIEDSTLQGVASRDLSLHTWPLWWKHCTTGIVASLGSLPAVLPPLAVALPSAAESRSTSTQGTSNGALLPTMIPSPGVQPADYRKVFNMLVAQLEERRASSRKKLREAWGALKQDVRTIQVGCTTALQITSRIQFILLAVKGLLLLFSVSSSLPMQVIEPVLKGGKGAVTGAKRHGKAPQQLNARQRIMKKLGIPAPKLAFASRPRGVTAANKKRDVPTLSALKGVGIHEDLNKNKSPLSSHAARHSPKKKKKNDLIEEDIFSC